MSRLLIIRGAQTGVAYDLGERTRIGRLGENEIQVPDPNVSRIHAEIVLENDSYVIYDKGSKNGILINGSEIGQKTLTAGDEIVIGGASFIFDPDFNLKNARYSDNSVYFVYTFKANEAAAIVLNAEQLGDSKVPAVALARIFGNELTGMATLSERMAAGIKQFFNADHVVLLLKDHPHAELQPFEALPYGEAVAINGEMISRAVAEKAAISTIHNLPAVPGIAGGESDGDDVELGQSEQFADTGSKGSTPQGPSSSPTYATMCAPIFVQQDLMGMLVVDKQDTRHFEEEALATLYGIATLSSYWLQAARLVERAKLTVRTIEVPDAEQRSASTRSLRMQEIYNSARRSADGAGTVLISGEYGTGKETLARFVHESGSRASGPFVMVNCASIPPEQFEQELFGYEKGAFEGADTTRPGRVEEAQGGTLFLSEIGELELSLQPKLLRFLQDKAFYRQGGHRALETDIRIIASTTTDLAAAVRAGKFRVGGIGLYTYNLREARIQNVRMGGTDSLLSSAVSDWNLY